MKFDDLRKLHQKKFRESFGHFLVEGEHLVLELQKAALHDSRLRGSEIYVTHEFGQWQSPFPTHVINARHMAQLSETRAPQGIVAVVPLLTPPPARAGEIAICLHQIQDPGNLGTILRTLAWLGSFRCLLTPGSVELFNAKAIRASMGACSTCPWKRTCARSRWPRVIRASPASTSAARRSIAGFREHDCYLFGSEAHGLPPRRIRRSPQRRSRSPEAA
jgi:RNA methyltransferase, TrmH family